MKTTIIVLLCLVILTALALLPERPITYPWVLSQEHANSERHYWGEYAHLHDLVYSESISTVRQTTTYTIFVDHKQVETVSVWFPWYDKGEDIKPTFAPLIIDWGKD